VSECVYSLPSLCRACPSPPPRLSQHRILTAPPLAHLPSSRQSRQAPSAAEFAQLSSLLQHKCDENDDLTNNLRLAKESLRHLSQELDEKSEAAERLKVSFLL